MQVTELEEYRETYMLMEERCKSCHNKQILYKLMGEYMRTVCAKCGSLNMKRKIRMIGLTIKEARYFMERYYGEASRKA